MLAKKVRRKGWKRGAVNDEAGGRKERSRYLWALEVKRGTPPKEKESEKKKRKANPPLLGK